MGGIMGCGMGRMLGVGIAGIAGGRGGTMSRLLLQIGTWRHVPEVQSKLQTHPAAARRGANAVHASSAAAAIGSRLIRFVLFFLGRHPC